MSPITWLTTTTTTNVYLTCQKQTNACDKVKSVYLSTLNTELQLHLHHSKRNYSCYPWQRSFFMKTPTFKKLLKFKHWKKCMFPLHVDSKNVSVNPFLQIFWKMFAIMWMEFITVQNIRHLFLSYSRNTIKFSHYLTFSPMFPLHVGVRIDVSTTCTFMFPPHASR